MYSVNLKTLCCTFSVWPHPMAVSTSWAVSGGPQPSRVAADAPDTSPALTMLIKLDGALVSFGGFSGTKGPQVTATPGFRVFLTRVEPILTGF